MKSLLTYIATGFLLLCLGGGVAAYVLWSNHSDENDPMALLADSAQLQNLIDQRATQSELDTFFREVAETQSGVYAFSLMKEGSFYPGIDVHALGHSIGEIMYGQVGISGMALCTHDFGNACSHTMVIGALMEEGVDALPLIQDACHDAPGGYSAYVECFHGLGHGVLAFNGYSVERAVAMCHEVGTPELEYQDAVECFGGALMELMSGGGHDRDIWEKQRAHYLDTSEPFGLCEQSYLDERYQEMCYIYLTPFAYESFGTSSSDYSDDVLQAVFRECETVPSASPRLRQACFAGLGKEFIGMSLGLHSANRPTPTQENLQQIQDWCSLALSQDGYSHCTRAVVRSLYAGDLYSYTIPLAFCALVPTEKQSSCYTQVEQEVAFYLNDEKERAEFCAAFPSSQQHLCTRSE